MEILHVFLRQKNNGLNRTTGKPYYILNPSSRAKKEDYILAYRTKTKRRKHRLARNEIILTLKKGSQMASTLGRLFFLFPLSRFD